MNYYKYLIAIFISISVAISPLKGMNRLSKSSLEHMMQQGFQLLPKSKLKIGGLMALMYLIYKYNKYTKNLPSSFLKMADDWGTRGSPEFGGSMLPYGLLSATVLVLSGGVTERSHPNVDRKFVAWLSVLPAAALIEFYVNTRRSIQQAFTQAATTNGIHDLRHLNAGFLGLLGPSLSEKNQHLANAIDMGNAPLVRELLQKEYGINVNAPFQGLTHLNRARNACATAQAQLEQSEKRFRYIHKLLKEKSLPWREQIFARAQGFNPPLFEGIDASVVEDLKRLVILRKEQRKVIVAAAENNMVARSNDVLSIVGERQIAIAKLMGKLLHHKSTIKLEDGSELTIPRDVAEEIGSFLSGCEVKR